MRGAPTDNNATLFAQGYDAVLEPHFKSGAGRTSSNPAGTWDPPTALTEFQQQFTAHPNINAALIPNDENGAPIIHYLQSKGIKAKTFPTTGPGRHADRPAEHPDRLPVRHRLQADLPGGPGRRGPGHVPAGRGHAAGRPGERHDQDTDSQRQVPSVLLTPTWVTTANMNATVIADNFVPASQLCSGKFAAAARPRGSRADEWSHMTSREHQQ